ncbi:MAG: UDP-N-acetylglucosamine:LPS N-acetylglucosamine transferase [Clostridiaceae bacterium]|jgi:UDP-N-acetylglucosamine:LPS N-acetylglucosamine transferase|nr:UDP-N-acetylglucosamine:LPS N-acetylglucosamine transferase [Clostridiaceae bacterium]
MNESISIRNIKVCLVGSSGGHLTHLYMLKKFWKDKERFWVTFDKEDARSILDGEKVYTCYFPTNRNFKNLVKNTFVACNILRKEKPDLLISSGAAVSVPFFYIAKLMGKKLIYIEVYDRIDKPTMSGKMVYPIVDVFIVQWEEQKKVYPKAINIGGIF